MWSEVLMEKVSSFMQKVFCKPGKEIKLAAECNPPADNGAKLKALSDAFYFFYFFHILGVTMEHFIKRFVKIGAAVKARFIDHFRHTQRRVLEQIGGLF